MMTQISDETVYALYFWLRLQGVVLVLTKADLVSPQQLQAWTLYLQRYTLRASPSFLPPAPESLFLLPFLTLAPLSPSPRSILSAALFAVPTRTWWLCPLCRACRGVQ
jgi:hypothetical protein